ncbi:MAG: ankyrin repeat domain-containing protein [Aestuariibacter sp.]
MAIQPLIGLFMRAVYAGHFEATDWLLRKNADISLVGHGNAVQIAKRRGFPKLITLLCKQANCNDSISKNVDTLASQIESGEVSSTSVLAQLVKNAHLLDETGRPLLHRAARLNRTQIVKAMLSRKNLVNLKDDIGFTPLMEAARNGHLDMVKLLISKGASVDSIADKSALNLTALHLAAITGHLEIIEVLFKTEANLNAVDTNNSTAMLWAIFEGQIQAAQKLKALGADATIENKHGMSASQFIKQ